VLAVLLLVLAGYVLWPSAHRILGLYEARTTTVPLTVTQTTAPAASAMPAISSDRFESSNATDDAGLRSSSEQGDVLARDQQTDASASSASSSASNPPAATADASSGDVPSSITTDREGIAAASTAATEVSEDATRPAPTATVDPVSEASDKVDTSSAAAAPDEDAGMPPRDKPHHLRTIFVSLASYRDAQCPLTVENMLRQAEFPGRIHLGINQQNGADDVDCFNALPNDLKVQLGGNIRMVRIKNTEALGPQSARYICSTLYEDEDYFMQIDSHMRFAPKWDTLQLTMWEDTCREHAHAQRKIIVSSYPVDHPNVSSSDFTQLQRTVTTAMCKIIFNPQGMIQPTSGILKIRPPNAVPRTLESPFIAAGYFFGPGRLVRDVPYDDDLPFLFHGEEALYSVRLWAAGYRIYNPTSAIVSHFYIKQNDATAAKVPKRRLVWELGSYAALNAQSTERVKRSLLLSAATGAGVKLAPSSEDVKRYYQHFKIDLEKKSAPNLCAFP